MKKLLNVIIFCISLVLFSSCEYPPLQSIDPCDKFDTSDPLGLEFVLVDGGTFIMGSAETETGRFSNETQHTVFLDTFSISKYEITQAQWEQVMGDEGHDTWNNAYGWGNNFPAYRVSFDDIQKFISKLNANQSEYVYSLPTESEWEYAARGGKLSQSNIYSGGNEIDNLAWYKENSSIIYCEAFETGRRAHIVGGKTANELGLFDMSGNMSEICLDFAGATYKDSVYLNPKGPASGSNHVIRGGSVMNADSTCRVAAKGNISSTERSPFVGFRLVRKPYVAVESVSLQTNTTITLYKGQTYALFASVLPENASYTDLIWTSSKPAVATVSNVGLVKAVSPNTETFDADTTIITVKTKDGNKMAECEIIVLFVDAESVSLDKIMLDLYVTQNATLTATVTPDTASYKIVKWTSADAIIGTDTIITLDSITGKIVAKKAGIANVIATTHNGLTATCEVTVAPYIAVTGVTLDKTNIVFSIGDSEQLTATILPSNASNQKFTWVSSDNNVARVSNSGVVMALAKGNAKITVTTEDGSKTAECNVKVN